MKGGFKRRFVPPPCSFEPNGVRFASVEHVAAFPGSWRRRIHQLLRRPWQWFFEVARALASTLRPEFKIAAAAGDGVELPVRTDHELVAGFEPVVTALGLGSWMYGLSALELTTSSFGHFGTFPPEDQSGEIGTVDDWFGLLNSDERDGIFVVGSSDSHTIMKGSPVGYPRTCVFVGTDNPEMIRTDANPPQTIKGLIRDGRSVINGGIYIRPTSPGVRPGDTITGSGPYQIELQVQAPLWVGNVELIEMWTSSNKVITNTVIATGMDAAIDNGSVSRFLDVVEVPDGTDWVVFHARGAYDPTIEDRSNQPQSLDPVHPGRLPFGVTNPIFFGP